MKLFRNDVFFKFDNLKPTILLCKWTTCLAIRHSLRSFGQIQKGISLEIYIIHLQSTNKRFFCQKTKGQI